MRYLYCALIVTLSFNAFSQDTITGCLNLDFENIEGLMLFEGLEISDQFEASFGLSFEVEGGGAPVLAEVGGASPFAFGSGFGPDTPNPIDAALVGNWFLTDDGIYVDANAVPVILNFSTPIDSFSGCILDMDGPEEFLIEAFGVSGNLILSETIMAGDPNTGDGRATCWGFSFGNCTGVVSQIKFTGTRPDGVVFGLGLDNFSFCYAGVSEALEYTICQGETIEVNNEVFSEPGTYEQQFTTATGCDSLVYIVVDVLPNVETEEAYSICDGSSIEINGTEYDEPGEFTQVLQTQDGCDSTVLIVIDALQSFEIEESYSICEGSFIEVNDEVYDSAGSYTQMLQTLDGCDSIINIALEVLPAFEEIQNVEICSGEVIEINGEIFESAGTYLQELSTSEGCDSILQINIEENPDFEMYLFENICENDTIVFNGEFLTEAGTYIFEEQTTMGCDSTTFVELEVNPDSFTTLEEKTCENEIFEYQGQILDTSGEYFFGLSNANGCDSTVQLFFTVIPVSESFQSFTIFEGDSLVFNGESYFDTGDYSQVLIASNGCDSILNISLEVLPLPETVVLYDLENCSTNDGFGEMTPSYPSPLEFTVLDASILSRDENYDHSCTQGVDGNLAMCISSMPSCTYDPTSDYTLQFQLEIAPKDGKVFVLTELSFFEKGPEFFSWASGGTGLNNYPTSYALRILRDGIEIFFQEDLPTNLDWTEQVFDFSSNLDFEFEEDGILVFELLPYCVVGNPSPITAWEIDQLAIKAYETDINAQLNGRITSLTQVEMPNVSVSLTHNDQAYWTETNEDGFYAFDDLLSSTQYTVQARSNKDVMDGVSTLDLILIQKHLLGIQNFDVQAQFIAADINKSNSITALDLIELRKVILGIHTDFPNNTSWRFFQAQQGTESPWDKQEQLEVSSTFQEINFEGIKIGDIDFSSEAYANDQLQFRSTQEVVLQTQIENVPESEQVLIHFIASKQAVVAGLQLNLKLDHTAFKDIQPGVFDLNMSHVHIDSKGLKISWNQSEKEIKKGQILFSIKSSQNPIELSLLHDEFLDEMYVINENRKLEVAPLDLSSFDQDEAFASDDFNIFPNPTRDILNVSYHSEHNEELTLELIDIHGKAIKSFKRESTVGNNLLEINLLHSSMPRGIFYLRIRGNTQIVMKQILKL